MIVTVKTALSAATKKLDAIPGVDAFVEANILLAHTLDKPRSWLFAWPEHDLSEDKLDQFNRFIQRRTQGEPISYITGKREFYSLELKVSTNTLIPRHETELLVDSAFEFVQQPQAMVLELGTGTGAITAALATKKPGWNFMTTDIREETLEIARFNFDKFHLEVQTILSDWFRNVPPQRFDLIISNPPYIESNDLHLQQGDLRFEPQLALASGPDGLDAIRQITSECSEYLNPGGFLMLEHGYNQKTAVQGLFKAAGLKSIETRQDLQGMDRVTIGQLSN